MLLLLERSVLRTRFTWLKIFLQASGISGICSICTGEPRPPDVVWAWNWVALTSAASGAVPFSEAKDCRISEATFKRSLLIAELWNPSDDAAKPSWPVGTQQTPLMPVL